MSKKTHPLRRSDTRSEVIENEVRGIAAGHGSKSHYPFLVWDISDGGLRLWMPAEPQAGESLKLTIARPCVITVMAQVKWAKPIQDGSGYEVGLKALDQQSQLETLHKLLADTRSLGVHGPIRSLSMQQR